MPAPFHPESTSNQASVGSCRPDFEALRNLARHTRATITLRERPFSQSIVGPMPPEGLENDVRAFKTSNPTIASGRSVVTKLLYRCHKCVPIWELGLDKSVLTWAELDCLHPST